MEQSPSLEANGFSASQEILRIVWNPKVHYRMYKCPPPVYPEPARSCACPTSHFLKIHLNIILPPTPGFPKWPPSLRFSHQNLVHASSFTHTCYMPSPSHSSRVDHRTIFGEQYSSLSSSLCSALHSPVTSSLLGPNIFLSSLFSNTP